MWAFSRGCSRETGGKQADHFKMEADETIPDIYQSKKMAVLYNMSLDELIDFDIDINDISRRLLIKLVKK